MATHSSVLAWRIPWTEEPGGLQSTGSRELDKTEAPGMHVCIRPHWRGGGWFCSLAVELQRLTWDKCCCVSDEVVFRVCPWTGVTGPSGECDLVGVSSVLTEGAAKLWGLSSDW